MTANAHFFYFVNLFFIFIACSRCCFEKKNIFAVIVIISSWNSSFLQDLMCFPASLTKDMLCNWHAGGLRINLAPQRCKFFLGIHFWFLRLVRPSPRLRENKLYVWEYTQALRQTRGPTCIDAAIPFFNVHFCLYYGHVKLARYYTNTPRTAESPVMLKYTSSSVILW